MPRHNRIKFDLINDQGIALLSVMLIMAALLIIIYLLIGMAEQDRKLTNMYDNSKQAFYLAEAGADLAINRWIDYINSTHTTATPAPDTISVNEFLQTLDSDSNLTLLNGVYQYSSLSPSEPARYSHLPDTNARYDLEQTFRTKNDLESNSQEIWIYYRDCGGYEPSSGKLYDFHDFNNDDYKTLWIEIEANYKGEVYLYKVSLRYCYHGYVYAYKG
jgi:hypothetical protein